MHVYAQSDPIPTITLLPPAAPVNTPITVKGANFKPGATVDLRWFGYIVDVKGIKGHIGYYPIKTGITVGSDGNFLTTIMVPYDFADVSHFVNATQNGVGTGIANATFTIVPILTIDPQPANYTEGQEVFLRVYGAPLGTPAFMMKFSPRLTVLKFTYDNMEWGYATSHLETEGPIVTGGFIGGDIGGNITIRFKAVGGVGRHNIRGYVGEKDTPPYLPCEIGGEGGFYIVGPGLDTQIISNKLGSFDTKISGIQGDEATVKTNLGTLTASTKDVKTATDSATNYSLGALGLSAINLVILLAVAVRGFRRS